MAEPQLTRIAVQALPCVDKTTTSTTITATTTTATEAALITVADRNQDVIPRLPDSQVAVTEVQLRKKRGRPPRNLGFPSAAPVPVAKKSKKEDEDVCFICFDGGNLVLCDYRDCPKAYHPACVKRDESFFRRSIRWNCGWHLCNFCQRNALFMCYTCPYSLCKRCVKQADILCVRKNRGFCRTCMTTIMLIENIPLETKEQVQVDFDDTTSWEYLFKVYWIYLKEKEALTLDELTRATNPWKVSGVDNYNFQQKRVETCLSHVSELSSSHVQMETNGIKRRKTRKQQHLLNLDAQNVDKPDENKKVSGLHLATDWASKELLEFVAHVKNGETSVLSQFDVQALLLDYIRRNNLRDPRRKCQIICDRRLESLFGKERVGHFEMLKLLEYHFKEESRTSGVIRGAADDPLSGHLENEGISGDVQTPSRETRRQSRKKAEDKGRQIKMDSYAAINVHNITLIYLKRSLLENLMVDAEKFHDKVVGSVVRIRITSNDQKQDMHRLVRIIGTSKTTVPYKIGEKTDSFMLKILNLNKIEDVAINAISDQEFSEDECKRLRQSIKLGLVERMTVGEIHEKAISLQTTRVDDWLETEIKRLNHLRDRASEMGHRKELRECVEKIELLKAPEERSRRIHEIPDVHADPRMDPSYGSDDDSGESDILKQDGSGASKYSNSKGMELISPVKADVLKDDRTKALKTIPYGERKRKNSAKFHVGKFETATRLLEPSHKSERVDATSKVLEEFNNRADLGVGSGSLGVSTTKSISLATSDSATTALSSRILLVSDMTELEKIWHYQDPSGKVQGPFCMLQLRKWDSNGFFPTDLRVWKINETRDESILLTDALRKQQTNEPEPHVEQLSCSQSYCGLESDDRKVDPVEEFSSNSDAPYMGQNPNEEVSNKNLSDINGTSEAYELPVNGCRSLLVSENQGGIDQSSGLDIKARLIQSLFDTEEPSSTATPTGSSETMPVTLTFESTHPSTSTSKSVSADVESQAVKSQPFSPNVAQLDSEIGWGLTSHGTETSDFPSSRPKSDSEDFKGLALENHVASNLSRDFNASCGTVSNPTKLSLMPKMEHKVVNNHDTENKKSAASVGCELDSGTDNTAFGDKDDSMLPSASPKAENEGMTPHTIENRQISPSIPGRDSEAIWSTISGETEVSSPSSNNINTESTGRHNIENKHYNTSNVPELDPGNSWSTISGGIVFSDLSSTVPKPESNSLDTSAIENKVCGDPNIPGQGSGTSWTSLSEGIEFPDLPQTSLKLDVASREAVGNKISVIQNVPGPDSCISWSTTSSLVGGEVHLPDVASEWCAFSTVHVKPVEEFNSGLVSGTSAKLVEVSGDHANPTLTCHLTNPHCESWQPIELSTLGDESVSDLLSEVEAMESLRGMSSPTSRMNCGDDSINSPGDDCFSPLGGLSPNLDPEKNNALSSTADMHFHVQPNITDQHGSFTVSDLQRTTCILSTGSPQVEDKPAIAFMPHQNFVSEASVSEVLPPAPPPPPPPPPVTLPPQPPASLPPSLLPPPASLPVQLLPSPEASLPPTSLPPSSLPPSALLSTSLPLPLLPPPQAASLSPVSLSPSPPPPPQPPTPPPPTPSLPSPPPLPPPEEKLPSPPSQPPSSTLSLNSPSSPREEGEVDPASLSLNHPKVRLHHQPFPQIPSLKVVAAGTWNQGSENTSSVWEPPGNPSGKSPGTGSILGNPNLHWGTSGPCMAAASVDAHWNNSVVSQVARSSSQTSPRYNHSMGRLSVSKDRSHNHHGVDSGFSKSRPTSWSRQSSLGGGGGSSRPPRGQRVCKFYESGYCKKGASCKYLHP